QVLGGVRNRLPLREWARAAARIATRIGPQPPLRLSIAIARLQALSAAWVSGTVYFGGISYARLLREVYMVANLARVACWRCRDAVLAGRSRSAATAPGGDCVPGPDQDPRGESVVLESPAFSRMRAAAP